MLTPALLVLMLLPGKLQGGIMATLYQPLLLHLAISSTSYWPRSGTEAG